MVKKLNKAQKAFRSMFRYDADLRRGGKRLVGIDEVGRGCLAGPLTIGAVEINPSEDHTLLGVYDSKAISKKERERLYPIIREASVSGCISFIQPEEIDEDGMSVALRRGVWKAVEGLAKPIDENTIVIMDGAPISDLAFSLCIPEENIVFKKKGDQTSLSVAAASIAAKVQRDRVMYNYSLEYPQYGFDKNMGYGTQQHFEALFKHGPCTLHRFSFNPVTEWARFEEGRVVKRKVRVKPKDPRAVVVTKTRAIWTD